MIDRKTLRLSGVLLVVGFIRYVMVGLPPSGQPGQQPHRRAGNRLPLPALTLAGITDRTIGGEEPPALSWRSCA
jgi:hypothetical protein